MTTVLQYGDLSCYTASAAQVHFHHEHEVVCMTNAGNLILMRLTSKGGVSTSVTGYYDKATNCWVLYAPDGQQVDACQP